jgi:hypothetical protein
MQHPLPLAETFEKRHQCEASVKKNPVQVKISGTARPETWDNRKVKGDFQPENLENRYFWSLNRNFEFDIVIVCDINGFWAYKIVFF